MADALGTPPAAATPTVGVVSDEDHRLALAGLIAPQTSSLAVRTGVMWGPGTTTLVTGTAATGTMTVSIALHHAVTTRGTGDGVYLGPTLEAATTVNIAAAPGANSRIDVVYVRQKDSSSTISPDAATAPEYGVVTGTAAASPTKPALTSVPGAIELATVTVATGATATNGAGVTITQTSRLTSARGTPIPCRSQTERDALTAFDGLSVKRLDLNGAEEQRINGAWVRVATNSTGSVPRMTAGLFSGTTSAGGDVTITHGLGATPASVSLTMSGVGNDGIFAKPSAGTLTSTTIPVRVYDTRTGNVWPSAAVNIYWIALIP